MSESENTAQNTREKLQRARELRQREAEAERDGSEPIGVAAHAGPAQRRNEPIREQFRAEVSADDVTQFVRRRREDRTVGTFDVPSEYQKPGWSYQWMTIRVLNQPVDPGDLRDFTENGGWRPVLAREMPSMTDRGAPTDSYIEVRGQRLYERPLRLTREAQQEDLEYAQEQQRDRTLAAANGKSAKNGSEGMGDVRGTRRVPLSIEIESLAG